MTRSASPQLTTTTPQIYVACLPAYVAGRLHGEWIDASQDAEEIRAEIAEMLARSPEPDAEEWAIHDTSGFDGVPIGEHESLERVAALAELLLDYPGAVVAAFLDGWGERGADELISAFRDAHGGCWTSVGEFADEVLVSDDVKEALGEELYGYLGLARYAHDSEADGGFSTVGTPSGVHVIWKNY
ncbi:antirestriction protein ArdA [Actinoallomurus sp. NBC_01490]|uniref:antirestriction protein ArdA n=1 Tax=Actinoallomurus sp. NBC_01490 TaxID=2903557 RepID=UPI002E381F5F|nr:antirestriction protein ArdA [Actinoallomurus sp. NBC_01490]